MSQAEYMRDYRARNPNTRERQTKLDRAKRKAAADLIERHQDEYWALLAKRKEEEGL